MLSKKIQLKTIDYKFVLTICFLLFFNSIISAQEIIKDSVIALVPAQAPTWQKQKIDGIIATVGDYIGFGF